jgi:hypothetical protein
MNILILSDIGMASPRILNIAEGLNEIGHQTYLLTPSMTRKQRKLFGVDLYTNLNLIYLKNFRMRYFRNNTVLTSKLMSIIYKVLDKIRFHSRTIRLQINEYQMLKIHATVNQTLRVVDKHKIDILLTSSGPISMQVIGNKIKEQRQITWIADYQDLWSQNHNSKAYSKVQFKRFEKQILRSADGVITVSENFSKKMSFIYSGFISTIYLGYMPSPKITKTAKSSRLTILYSGQVYSKYQKLFEFLDCIIKNQNIFEHCDFIFVGQSSKLVKNYFSERRIKVPTNFTLIGFVDRKKSIELQHRADILLIFKWENLNETGILPTKFFEYVSANKPILAYGTTKRDELSNFIFKYNLGYQISSSHELVLFLENLQPLKNFAGYKAKYRNLEYKAQAVKLDAFIVKARG